MINDENLFSDFSYESWAPEELQRLYPMAPWEFSLVPVVIWGVISEAAGHQSGMAVSGLGC